MISVKMDYQYENQHFLFTAYRDGVALGGTTRHYSELETPSDFMAVISNLMFIFNRA